MENHEARYYMDGIYENMTMIKHNIYGQLSPSPYGIPVLTHEFRKA
jgi:hypothetical protein